MHIECIGTHQTGGKMNRFKNMCHYMWYVSYEYVMNKLCKLFKGQQSLGIAVFVGIWQVNIAYIMGTKHMFYMYIYTLSAAA